MKKKSVNARLILLGIFIVYIVLYYVWLTQRGMFDFFVNTHVHSTESLDLYKYISQNPTFLNVVKIFSADSYWPRLHYLFTLLFINLFGNTYISMGMVNMLYLLIAIYAMYGLTSQLTQNKWCGIISALIVISYPGIIFFLKAYELQIGVVAFTTLAVYFLVVSDYYMKVKYCILFSVSFCCAMYMDRFSPLFFMIGPFFYVFISMIKMHRAKKRIGKGIVNWFISCLLIILILSPFYFPWIKINVLDADNFKGMMSFSGEWENIMQEYFDGTGMDALKRLFFYVILLPHYYLGILWTILFLIGLVLYLTCVQRGKGLLLSWLITPYIIFTLLPKKDGSYLIASLPSIAVITSIGIFSLKKKISYVMITITVICAILIYGGCMFYNYRTVNMFFIKTSFDSIASIRPIEYEDDDRQSQSRLNKWLLELMHHMPMSTSYSVGIINDDTYIHDDELPYKISIFLSLYNPLCKTFLSTWIHTIEYFVPCNSDYLIFISDTSSNNQLEDAIYEWLHTSGVVRYRNERPSVNIKEADIDFSRYMPVLKKKYPYSSLVVSIFKRKTNANI
ncbi:MAG: hypothetical protein KKH94_12970 [Candidatus Omnitrophica bacterium]|nr:hypothetical protein [Candidatus Omnitrophota bacterium]